MNDEQLFKDDPLDPETAKVADRYIALTKEKKSVKEKFDIQAKNLTGLLKKLGKSKIRHGGFIIEVIHKDEDDTVKLKADKAAPKEKAKRTRAK